MSGSVRLVILAAAVAVSASCTRGPAIEIVAFGDSITEGVREGVEKEQTFVRIVEERLRAKGLDVGIVNRGVAGEETSEAIERFDDAVLERRPRIVTIMYGTNDSFVDDGQAAERVTREQFRQNLETMVARALAKGIRPVLMTEPRWGPRAINGLKENPNARLERYVEIVRTVAKERGLRLVDHFADWSAAERAGTDVGAWTVDQCHPNPEGHRRMADLLEPALAAELGAS